MPSPSPARQQDGVHNGALTPKHPSGALPTANGDRAHRFIEPTDGVVSCCSLLGVRLQRGLGRKRLCMPSVPASFGP